MNYVIASDFHEDASALEYILVNYSTDQIILLGDFFDSYHGDARGMAKVISKLYHNEYKLTYEPIVIIGNHDEFLLGTANRDILDYQTWMLNGGKKTLKHLGYKGSTNSLEKVARFLNSELADVMNFLDKAKYMYENEALIAVHGGLDWELYDPRNTPDADKVWLRDEYLGELPDNPHPNDLGKVIVSGHTPVQNYQDGASIIKMQANEYDVPRYLVDGGSKSGASNGRVNILILDEKGKCVGTDYAR